MHSRAGVVIAVAGLSTRMGEFKPLLPLGDKTIIEHVVDNAAAGGIQEIVVVVGKEKDRIREQLGDRKIKLVENPDFASTDMLQSIKCGLSELSASLECFFIVPGDMPLISKACYQCMLSKFESRKKSGIVQIRYQGDGGHPILIGEQYRDSILDYEGKQGLKGALRPFADNIHVLEWHNSTILLDADTPYDYAHLKDIYDQREIPGKMVIFTMFNLNGTPIEVVRHSLAVEKIALLLADKARKRGYPIRMNLVSAAALLHDVERTKPRHAQRGAQLLRKLGYEKVASIVEEHMFLSQDAVEHLDERAIVFLADKMVEGTRAVSLEERFEKRLFGSRNEPEVYEKIKRNMENAKKVMELLE